MTNEFKPLSELEEKIGKAVVHAAYCGSQSIGSWFVGESLRNLFLPRSSKNGI